MARLMAMPGRWAVRLATIAGALLVFMVVGHFWATDLTVEDRPLVTELVPTGTWTELQVFFDDCLKPPVPLARWHGEAEAGVVVVLGMTETRGLFEIVRCFEVADMAGGTGSVVAETLFSLQARAESEQELVVTSCGTGALDEASRRRFQQEFSAHFGLLDTD